MSSNTERSTSDKPQSGPNGCTHAIIIKGEHFWCDENADHGGWPHGSVAAQTIWGDAAVESQY